jgi:hypothetical protein
LSRSWLHTFRSFTTPLSLVDYLVDRFDKPLRHFNALAPLDARLSGSQRNAIVSHTRTQVCYVLASDFLADSELFADSRICWWQRADVCRLARGLVPRVAGRDGAAVSPQAAGVRGADQENAQHCGTSSIRRGRCCCSTTTWSWSRQNGAGGARRLFACASERADVARLDEGRGRRARAQLPEHYAHHQPVFDRMQPLGGVGMRVRVTDDAQMRLSMLKRFIDVVLDRAVKVEHD